jgi:hypothetical protein
MPTRTTPAAKRRRTIKDLTARLSRYHRYSLNSYSRYAQWRRTDPDAARDALASHENNEVNFANTLKRLRAVLRELPPRGV